MNDADRIFSTLVAFSRNVATTNTNTDSHIKSAAISHGSNYMLWVDERKLSWNVQICTGNRARTFRMNMSSSFNNIAIKRAENQALNVQNDISNVFDYTFSGSELMLYAINLNSGCFCSIKRREQNSTHAVTESITIATLERLNDEAGNKIVNLFSRNCRPHELCHI